MMDMKKRESSSISVNFKLVGFEQRWDEPTKTPGGFNQQNDGVFYGKIHHFVAGKILYFYGPFSIANC